MKSFLWTLLSLLLIMFVLSVMEYFLLYFLILGDLDIGILCLMNWLARSHYTLPCDSLISKLWTHHGLSHSDWHGSGLYRWHHSHLGSHSLLLSSFFPLAWTWTAGKISLFFCLYYRQIWLLLVQDGLRLLQIRIMSFICFFYFYLCLYCRLILWTFSVHFSFFIILCL